MKVQNNNHYINFHAGLTKQMCREIASCDITKISHEFSKYSIPTDFKENKIVAWCCLKCLELFKNKNLGLPKGIFVTDFKNLKTAESNDVAMTNIAPTQLFKNKDSVVPEKTIFFNSLDDYWNKIDSFADENFELGNSPTNYFLDVFLHEFSHVFHEENLLKKIGGQNLIELINLFKDDTYKASFIIKHRDLLSQICNYAASSPFEAVACDLTKKIINKLDQNSISLPNKFGKKLYKRPNIIEKFRESELDFCIRRFWNGKVK